MWGDAVDLPYMADRFHEPPRGEQQKLFEEIFINMMNEPEATYETARDPPPSEKCARWPQYISECIGYSLDWFHTKVSLMSWL